MFQTTMCLVMFCRMINAHLKKRKKGRSEKESWTVKREEGGTRPMNSGDDESNKGNYVPFVL